LSVDAPDLLARFDEGYGALLADLNIGSFADRRRRCDAVEAFLPQLWQVGEEILSANRSIRD
jgi:hypothetical protein